MNVPKLRFKEFTDEWQTHKLKNLCTTCGGGTPSKSITEYWTGNIPWISSSDLEATSIFKINVSKFITTKAISESATKIIPPNSILIVSRVGVGKVAINYNELCTSQDFTNLINIKGNSIFFTYLLKLKMEKQTQQTQGTSIKGITTNDIKNINCTFPNIKEQTKIANFLSTVDKKISNLEDIVTNLENQKKGLLQQIFNQEIRFKDENGNNYPDWKHKQLGDIATLKNGISKGNEAFGHGKKFINLQDIFNKSYIFNDNYSLVDVTEKELSENNLLKGDVLFVRSSVKREGVGLPCVIMENLIDTVYSGFIIRCRFNTNENIYLHYKKYCFLESSFRKALLKKSSSSANTNINQDNLSKLYVKLPCLEEQTKIADFLSAFDRKIDNQKAQLEHWKQIKKGLLQQMFV